MKHLARLALGLASLAGWSSAYSLDVSELCADFDIFKDPDTRMYRGAFRNEGVTLDHVLVVTEVTDEGKALVFYVHGKQSKWRIRKPGCSPQNRELRGRYADLADVQNYRDVQICG